jgi:SAM-dependent methyltransferase
MTSGNAIGETPRKAFSNRPNYGIDAPGVVLRFFMIGIVGLIAGLSSILALEKGVLPWARFVVAPALWMGGCYLVTAGVMIWGSKIGKLRLRDKLIGSIPWRGDEQVLDVGCGRGLMLIATAKRLRSGRATGIDIWRREDQTGNSREATSQNAQMENVSDRVALQDGDARKLPFTDNAFDVVISSWALHNISDPTERRTATREIIRVLKPGGRLAIVDIRHVPEYAQVLAENQFANIVRSRPNFLFVIPTLVLTARKPSLPATG